ncbi:MAG: hypothetical protein K6T30_07320 [Alicyclobacillus sp.]|nr:hypothetical protein [Alicyclobacillus sp.]
MTNHTPPGWTEPETVPVRPEAAFDPAALARFVRGRLPGTSPLPRNWPLCSGD